MKPEHITIYKKLLNRRQQRAKMRNFEISLIFISAIIGICFSLPVKESSSSTEKPSNNHHSKEDDSPQHNLENIIGELKKEQKEFCRHHQNLS